MKPALGAALLLAASVAAAVGGAVVAAQPNVAVEVRNESASTLRAGVVHCRGARDRLGDVAPAPAVPEDPVTSSHAPSAAPRSRPFGPRRLR